MINSFRFLADARKPVTIVTIEHFGGSKKDYYATREGDRVYIQVPLGGIRAFNILTGKPTNTGLGEKVTKNLKLWSLSSIDMIKLQAEYYKEKQERKKQMGFR
jgi:hypothetical protein